MAVKINKSQAKNIMALYKKKIDPKMIADVLSIPLDKVTAVIEGDYTTPTITKQAVRSFHELYDLGFGVEEIAKKTGWSNTTVKRHLLDVRPIEKKQPLSPEQRMKIRKMYVGGMRQSEIARATELSLATVRYAILDLIDVKKYRRLTQQERSEIVTQFAAGVSVADLADKYECHVATIYRALQKENKKTTK